MHRKYIPIYIQPDATLHSLYLETVLHVSTHPRHQPAATWVNTTRYCKESSAPDDGRKHRPKHVELTRNNKLTRIVASCWMLS
jgi:hypothetical protein